jgi:alkaline phosphatase D
MTSFSRRLALKLCGASVAGLGLRRTGAAANPSPEEQAAASLDPWRKTHDRVWLGAEYWANPMEDWQVVGGAAECRSAHGSRSVHHLTRQFENPDGAIAMSVGVHEVDRGADPGGAGFRVGVCSDINEYRSSCFAGGGINAGIAGGHLVLGDRRAKLRGTPGESEIALRLKGSRQPQRYVLTLTAIDTTGTEMATLAHDVTPDEMLGNVALASNFLHRANRTDGSKYRFTDWYVGGDALVAHPERAFGPILWSMYSLSDSRGEDGFILKMSALTGPLGKKDNKSIELQVQRQGQWVFLGEAELDEDSWTAIFRIANWDETKSAPFRLVYHERHTDGTISEFERAGTIRANPTGRPLRLGALTCQNDYAFPYEPVANNLLKLDPDLLYFSGDQIYENHGGFGIIRTPADRAILNYLRKFYQFGWSFGEAMRDRPTLCIPDDHDVFQGNLWGEGGAKMGTGREDTTGGYREPARMVNVVHRTCAGHHPDYFDPTPCKQEISVYFGDVVYGGVGFAILADRQFKSGPGHVNTGSGRPDHVIDTDIDPRTLDAPGLVLLGERQEKFLEHWVNDWRGHSMKVLLSQTVFAAVATHHGGYDGFLRADLDSGGWPQMPRNNALRILRKGMPLHINGDQHLTTLVQYGIDDQRDGCWSFCTPAIAVGYPRWWRPDEVGIPHQNRPKHGLPNTGEFIDSFGNKVYVYAVGNPDVGTERNRYRLAHQKGSGFGLVTIDTKAKTYKCESFRFLVDATDGNPANQFTGWPLTIEQHENAGRNQIS